MMRTEEEIIKRRDSFRRFYQQIQKEDGNVDELFWYLTRINLLEWVLGKDGY